MPFFTSLKNIVFADSQFLGIVLDLWNTVKCLTLLWKVMVLYISIKICVHFAYLFEHFCHSLRVFLQQNKPLPVRWSKLCAICHSCS